MPSTSIDKLVKEHNQKKEDLPLNLPEANNEFSEAELVKQWNAYAESLTDIKYVYLRNTMLDCTPVLMPNAELVVSVNHDKQEQEIRAYNNVIIQHLYGKLHNSHLKITIIIKEKEKVKEGNIYTAQEKFEYFRKKNPNIEILKEKLNLNF